MANEGLTIKRAQTPPQTLPQTPPQQTRAIAQRAHVLVERVARAPYSASLLSKVVLMLEACLDYKANRQTIRPVTRRTRKRPSKPKTPDSLSNYQGSFFG